MVTAQKILEIAKQKGKINTPELIEKFSVSRQYLNRLIKGLIEKRELIKVGETRSAFYVVPAYAQKYPEILPNRFSKTLKNISLQEHVVVEQIEQHLPFIKKLPENIRSILAYAFSEMLNNAIEHSKSKTISVEVAIQNKKLSFIVEDKGIGAFKNIMQKRNLTSELEAIQDLLKGKTTTMPKSHSGEGIFFTSKAADIFILDSFGYQLIIDNKIHDIFIQETDNIKKGTRVIFEISTLSKRHLNIIFSKYTNLDNESYGFDKTEIRIKLYTIGGIHISRSQARRVLTGLDKFKVILFDFEKVPTVGQAFADEIFRVFHNKYPNIKLETANMNANVEFMIKRAKTEAEKSQ